MVRLYLGLHHRQTPSRAMLTDLTDQVRRDHHGGPTPEAGKTTLRPPRHAGCALARLATSSWGRNRRFRRLSRGIPPPFKASAGDGRVGSAVCCHSDFLAPSSILLSVVFPASG